MKGLTLHQPWAAMVALGVKRYETRSWKTDYRGLLAIHSAQKWTNALSVVAHTGRFKKYWNAKNDRVQRFGVILCVVELVKCEPTTDVFKRLYVEGKQGFALDEIAFGDYSPGRWAWELKMVKVLPQFIECRGYQQLWTVPADIEGRLLAA